MTHHVEYYYYYLQNGQFKKDPYITVALICPNVKCFWEEI